ncbi:MAG: hypothetical protein KDA68_15975, partial [Planctomycetaceae bacterium]|nr:hypothetical protein [Planctomycetaceae bacterium]
MPTAKNSGKDRQLRLLAAVIVAGGALIAYWPSFAGKFFLDDDAAIIANPHLHQLVPIWPLLNPPGWMATLAGRPLLSLSLALNWAWGGDSVLGYHVVNFAIHAAAGVLVWLILQRLLTLPAMGERVRRSAWWLATVSALLWTLHPLQTESVTYIVQRAECMAGMFFLLSMYAFLAGSLGSDVPGRWYFLSVISCLLAMGTKESGAMIPLAILLLDRSFLSESWQRCFSRGRGLVYGSLFGCWLFQGLLMFSSNKRGATAGFGLGISSWEYAVSQFGIITRYLRLTFVPYPQVLDYGVWLAKSPEEIWPYALLIGVLVLGTLWMTYRDPRWGYGGLLFWLTLGPTSSVVPLVTQTAA